MQTYWDLEPKQRAALSRSDVERYLDAELMTKGVLRVMPPVLEPEPNIAPLPRATYFQPQAEGDYGRGGLGIAFKSAESVAAFLSLQPVVVRRVYVGSESIESAKPLGGGSVESEFVALQLSEFDDVQATRKDIERVASVRQSNKAKREQFEKECKEQTKALEGLWEDWEKCKALEFQMRRVVATFDDYVKTAGDEQTAARFLRKVFSDSKISEASEWCGVAIPAGVIDAEFPEVEAKPEPIEAADLTF